MQPLCFAHGRYAFDSTLDREHVERRMGGFPTVSYSQVLETERYERLGTLLLGTLREGRLLLGLLIEARLLLR
jgi:hypothetical protein